MARMPQVRKQIMDKEGNFHPVPEEPQVQPQPEEETPAVHIFKVGEHVMLTGRVLEVQHSQGKEYSVKVQLPQGALWLQDKHLELVPKKPKAEEASE